MAFRILCFSKVMHNTLPFKFDSVVAVEYRSEHCSCISDNDFNVSYTDFNAVVWDNSKFNPTATFKGKLPDFLAYELSEKLNSPTIYDKRFNASCYFPRLGLVFYRHDSIVAHVSVCLECFKLKTYPKLSNVEKSFGRLNGRGMEFFDRICMTMGFLYCKRNRDPGSSPNQLSWADSSRLLGRALLWGSFEKPMCFVSNDDKHFEIADNNIAVISYWYSCDSSNYGNISTYFSVLQKLKKYFVTDSTIKIAMVDMNEQSLIIDAYSYRSELVKILQEKYPLIYTIPDSTCLNSTLTNISKDTGKVYILGNNKKLKYIIDIDEYCPDFSEEYITTLVNVLKQNSSFR